MIRIVSTTLMMVLILTAVFISPSFAGTDTIQRVWSTVNIDRSNDVIVPRRLAETETHETELDYDRHIDIEEIFYVDDDGELVITYEEQKTYDADGNLESHGLTFSLHETGEKIEYWIVPPPE